MPLLMSAEGPVAAVAPLQKLLVDDMRGLSAGVLESGEVASPVTPMTHGLNTLKAPHPPTPPSTSNQVQPFTCVVLQHVRGI